MNDSGMDQANIKTSTRIRLQLPTTLRGGYCSVSSAKRVAGFAKF